MQQVTDFSTAYITLTREQFNALPLRVQSLLKMYGREEPRTSFNAPSVISIARYRIAEIEAAMEGAAK